MTQDDDRLLDAAARAFREAEGSLDERWDKLAAGELAPEEVEKLREAARQSPEAAAAWHAFQPLGTGFEAEMVRRIQETQGTAPLVVPAPVPTRAPTPLHWLRWSLLPASLAAAAAVIVLWSARPAPLPGYMLRLEGATSAQRGASPGAEAGTPATFVEGNRLELVLTPETDTAGAIEARVLLLAGGAVRPLPAPPLEQSPQGGVRLRGTVGRDVELPPGDSLLLVAVGRPGALPGPEALRAALQAASPARGDGWTGWAVPVHLRP
jgi:hypothetical protein